MPLNDASMVQYIDACASKLRSLMDNIRDKEVVEVCGDELRGHDINWRNVR